MEKRVFEGEARVGGESDGHTREITYAPMTIDLAELERLLAAATPGPWYHTSDGATIALAIDAGDDRFSVGHAPDIAHLDDHEYIENPRATADSALICAARNQLPALLARIRELELPRGPKG